MKAAEEARARCGGGSGGARGRRFGRKLPVLAPRLGPRWRRGRGLGEAGASQPACDTEGLRVWVYSQRSGGWVLP